MWAWTFDRTYEGLKLEITWTPSRDEVAFDRTYEGLKRPRGPVPRGPGPRF